MLQFLVIKNVLVSPSPSRKRRERKMFPLEGGGKAQKKTEASFL